MNTIQIEGAILALDGQKVDAGEFQFPSAHALPAKKMIRRRAIKGAA